MSDNPSILPHVSLGTNQFEAARAFYDATGDGASGNREHYGPGCYGAFARDLDGHKIEAMHWDADAT